MNFVPRTPRTGIVQPASQWSHAVPAYMPWAHPNNPAHFMRFQGGQMPVPGQFMVSGTPPAPTELYVHPGDPCSSRAVPTTQGQAPYPSFPSTSYCTPRFKRKMTCDPWEQIPAKQLVTERMLERLNGLSLQEPSTSGYVPVKSASSPAAPEGLMTSENSFEFADSKSSECTTNGAESNLIFTDTLKDIQRKHLAATTLEERLALNEVKKATMALVPWSPPLIPAADKKFEEFMQPSAKSEEEDCEASMEM